MQGLVSFWYITNHLQIYSNYLILLHMPIGQMIGVGLCWAYLSTSGLMGVLASPPATNELAHEGICKGPSES